MKRRVALVAIYGVAIALAFELAGRSSSRSG